MHTIIILFIVYPIIYAIIVGSVAGTGGGYNLQSTSCVPYDLAPSIIGICQCFTGVSVLVVFLGISLKYPMYSLVDEKEGQKNIYIWRVVTNARRYVDSPQNQRAWITIRFILVIILQAGSRLGFNAYYLVLAIGDKKSTYHKMGITDSEYASEKNAANWDSTLLVLLCYYLNGVVVLWANKGLQQWIYDKCVHHFGSSASSTYTDDQKETALDELSPSAGGDARIDVSTSIQDSQP